MFSGRAGLASVVCMLGVACTSSQPAHEPTPSPAVGATTNTTSGNTEIVDPNPTVRPPVLNTTWRVVTSEHVDLWLHAYAMLAPDSMPLPYFARGYRARMLNLQNQKGVTTLLDQNRMKLVAAIDANPALGTSGQFVALYFPTWEVMRQAIDAFVKGSARPSNATQQLYFAALAGAFPTAADREWLRLFTESANDESRLYYHDYWTTQNLKFQNVTAHVDTLWQRDWRPTLQRFLNNTQQQNGALYLSFPIGGEGRTVRFNRNENAVVVPIPGSFKESEVVLYVFAHEITGGAASAALADNTTPAEQRAGTTSKYEQSAAVRAGALLLERVMPAAVTGYMRYYLLQAGRTAPPDPRADFAATFAIPDSVLDAIKRQLDMILGGI